jgi:hypothetical protein
MWGGTMKAAFSQQTYFALLFNALHILANSINQAFHIKRQNYQLSFKN